MVGAAHPDRHCFRPHTYFTSDPEAAEWLNELSSPEGRELSQA
jgi:hypothetical protein